MKTIGYFTASSGTGQGARDCDLELRCWHDRRRCFSNRPRSQTATERPDELPVFNLWLYSASHIVMGASKPTHVSNARNAFSP